MDMITATSNYESWLAGLVPLYQPDLDYKHERLRDPANPFPFFRGTYYRWVQRWSEAAGDLADAPAVLSIGDLHVENFGTWRDPDGRLCWGVNDFDHADRLPYTQDLVRLAASVRFARRAGGHDLKIGAACKAILTGYRDALAKGGTPFVLEERHPELRALAMTKGRAPGTYWDKLTALLTGPAADPPEEARAALLSDLPAQGLSVRFCRRPQVGMGSLGMPRYVALAEWAGGWVAREAKAITPPPTAWAARRADQNTTLAAETLLRAVRCADPFHRTIPGWVVRRLGPRCGRLELTDLKHVEDVELLLRAMGAETANVHLGSPGAAGKIQADLSRRPKGWLEESARSISRLIEEDWTEWQKAHRRLARTRSS